MQQPIYVIIQVIFTARKAIQTFLYAESRVTVLIAGLMLKFDLFGKDINFDHGHHTKTCIF